MHHPAASPHTPAALAWTEILPAGFNSLWVCPGSSALYASNGRQWQRSVDGGARWTILHGPDEQGRHYNALGCDGDADGLGVSWFRILADPGIVGLDGGSHTAFARPAGVQHDGWTMGAVDWRRPQRLFAKEHHATRCWFSPDGGASWRAVDMAGCDRYAGLGFAGDGALLMTVPRDPAHGVAEDPIAGIRRSTDEGRSWRLVARYDIAPKQGIRRIGDRLWTGTAAGLAMSDDDGHTWRVVPGSPVGAISGPFRGAAAGHLALAQAEGLWRSQDDGATWSMVVPIASLPQPVRDADLAQFLAAFAYDGRRDTWFCGALGTPTWASRVLEPSV